MIRTNSLTKYYGTRCAVRDLSLEIQSKEIVGFLGLNGAGKTTTLRMLAGLLAPSSGSVEIDGQVMTAGSEHSFRRQIGFLPERPPLYEDMSVEDYVRFAAALRGYPPGSTNARVDEILRLTDLTHYRGALISELSHGYRQRVGIAQAIVHEPSLVILDEPTGGLDPDQIIEMRALIRNLKGRHTVLLSSHNLPEVSQTCDRLMVIKQGVLVDSGSTRELGERHGQGQFVELEIVGSNDQVSGTLTDLQGAGLFASFKATNKNGGDAQTIRLSLGQSKPEMIAKAIIEKGLGLRSLRPLSNELESLFIELTKEKS